MSTYSYVKGAPWSWGGGSKPYGGYITDISLRLGYNGPATASLTIVSQDGLYDIGPASLSLDACSKGSAELRLHFLEGDDAIDATEALANGLTTFNPQIKWRMYPHTYSISEGSGGATLTVELIEQSMDYFDKVLVVNKKFKPTDSRTRVDGLLFIGEEYYNDSSDSRGQLIRWSDMTARITVEQDWSLAKKKKAPYKNPELAEIARTQFGQWLWTPKDLGVELGKHTTIPFSPDAKTLLASYDDIYLQRSGTLQVVLQEIGGLLGLMFFWDSLRGRIDVMGEADCLALLDEQGRLILPEADKEILVSQSVNVSFENTKVDSQAQRAAMPGGSPGNPEFLITKPSKALSPIWGWMPNDRFLVKSKANKEEKEYINVFGPLENPPGWVLLGKDADEPTNEDVRPGFQALNLIKAFMLGDDFARVYILTKKIGAFQSRFPKPGVPQDGDDADAFLQVRDQKPPLEIKDFELVEKLFPDGAYRTEFGGAGEDAKAAAKTKGDKEFGKYVGFGLRVNSPADAKPEKWGEGDFPVADGKVKPGMIINPANPYWVARFLLLWKERNPFQIGALSGVKPGDELQVLLEDSMVAYVQNFKPLKAESTKNKDPKRGEWATHPILGASWSHPVYKALKQWAHLINRYFVVRGSYVPTCPEEKKSSAKTEPYEYSHMNWLALPKELQRLNPVTSSIPEVPAEYVNADDIKVLSDIGTAFHPKFSNVDTDGVTAADLVENITLGNKGPVTKPDKEINGRTQPSIIEGHSCLAPIYQDTLKNATEIDKANCIINKRDSIHIWENTTEDPITPEQRKAAAEWVEGYYYFDPDSSEQEDQKLYTAGNYYSPIILPRLTELVTIETEFRYFKNKAEEDAADGNDFDFEDVKVSQPIEFEDVDQLDAFLSSIDIGIDVNGYIEPLDIEFMEKPPRYERNEGELRGYCNQLTPDLYSNFKTNSINIEEYGSDQLMTMIPELGAEGPGKDDDGEPKARGSFEGTEYTEDCDKEEEAVITYSGVPLTTQNKIKKNLKVRAESLFSLSQEIEPTVSYTCSTQGAPSEFPTVKQGLSNISLSAGPDGPMITYTVGNKKFRASQEAQRQQLKQVPGNAAVIGDDPFAKKFSEKFVNKLEQKTTPRAMHAKGVKANPKLKSTLNRPRKK